MTALLEDKNGFMVRQLYERIILYDKKTNIRGLTLENTQDIPLRIGDFIKLEFLNISDNNLKKVPLSIILLFNLKIMKATCNPFGFPFELSFLVNLTYLELNWCNIIDIPPEIANLKNLIVIYLNHNFIPYLPVEMNNMRLRAIHLYSNKLMNLPSCVKDMKQLQFLDIRKNEVCTIEDYKGRVRIMYK